MASEDLYEVEQIMDKRKSKKGRVEYLVRWRGYGYEGDTWEPEMHLSNCMEFIHEFNRLQGELQQDGPPLRSGHGAAHDARKQICRPQQQPSDGPRAASSGLAAVPSVLKRQQQLPPPASGDLNGKPDTQHLPPAAKYRRLAGTALGMVGMHGVGTGRRSMDLARSGIKILVPKSPMKSRAAGEVSPSEAAQSLQQAGQEPDSVPPEVALLEKPVGALLGSRDERARMGTRPRTQTMLPPPQVPITPTAVKSLNGKGSSSFMEALATNGSASQQTTPMGAAGMAPKRRLEERSAFDRRLRFSVRQTESAYRYRDIVVRKQDGFTHILLSTKSSENNSLNPDVMRELQSAMSTAAVDDSKLVLLSAVGSAFCFGLDFIYFIRKLTDDRKKESSKMAESIRTFVNAFIQFKKPIVVAVNGPVVGLGAAILPLCDVVWANEKAWFQTPYSTFGQTPDACSSITFPRIMGVASASEMLLSGRKLTAQEACTKGLVSQVFWPGTFMQEVMVRIKELASCNSFVLQESKALVRSSTKAALEQANERECEALKRVWGSPQGLDSILKYLQKKVDNL
ncbi:chromodomain Y-like protein isoform X13 [Brienomyrus brachyistius]|uniref:chromodomain Y-like protein isoform X13 n=1 Tax=Brienomyrus brachyistius TaxID=42636 RepID=UPI0020B21847|nr:chromodomain Y-like protein isoform X13 [Brienomyrus brachyistius]